VTPAAGNAPYSGPVTRPADLSLWHDSMTDDDWGPDRAPLSGDTQVDVAIVGAGYTGLWTAYYLMQRDPSLRIVVVEAEQVGFGASGRNGGWCSALLPMGLDAIARRSSRDAAFRLQRAMHETVAEVGDVVRREQIDCHWAHGGTVSIARNTVQMDRLRQHIADLHSYGFGDDDHRLLDADETRARCATTDVVGGAHTPHCAAIHPARLARGLGRAVEARGVRIVEHTPAHALAPHRVETAHGTIRADVVVRATEAFTPRIAGLRREVAPVYSLMIATEPLPASFWDEAGLTRRETFHDERHLVIYGQRTADDRIAFGGRGARYHWASRIEPAFERDRRTHDMVQRTLVELFPALQHVGVTHRWGGAVGAPRDWWCHARFDRANGMASAGGYVGDGVGTSHLAGRTLADLITGTASDLVDLPWVQHTSRRWEPEPLRYVGINTMVQLPKGADRHEARTGRPSRWREGVMSRLIGG
jgi:glycine/D-amino acid oxidase-like deaminating enzyme